LLLALFNNLHSAQGQRFDGRGNAEREDADHQWQPRNAEHVADKYLHAAEYGDQD